jgi:hypothetical protein
MLRTESFGVDARFPGSECRWLIERALAIGPAAIMHAAPLTMPLPFPLTLPACITAPTASGSVPGWLPRESQASNPSGGGWHSDFGYDEGRGSHAAVLSVGANSVKKQAEAASAEWAKVCRCCALCLCDTRATRLQPPPASRVQVHKVAIPCMASSASAALHNLALEYSVEPLTIIARPAASTSSSASSDAAAADGLMQSSRNTTKGLDERLSNKHPHSLAATLAMPLGRTFGDAVTAAAKREGVRSLRYAA